MKITTKFNIFTVIIAVIFVVVFFISLHSIRILGDSSLDSLNASTKFTYIANLKNALTELDHTIDHYILAFPGVEDSGSIESELQALHTVLSDPAQMNLDSEARQIIKFGSDNFDKFSQAISGMLHNKGISSRQKGEIYSQWKKNYKEPLLTQIDKYWKQDLLKTQELLINAQKSKEKSLFILLTAASLMFLILVIARLLIDRAVMVPLKAIESASNAIASGDTGIRITLHSRDELGNLAASVNTMAQSIEDKVETLKYAVSREQEIVREQTILTELMSFIATGVSADLALRTFLGRTRDLLKAEHSSIFILDQHEQDKKPVLRLFLNTFEETSSLDCGTAMLNGVFSNTLKTFLPLRINTPMEECPATHLAIKNLLAVPISSSGKDMIGLMVVNNKEGGFSEHDEDTLLNFAFQAFQAIILQQEIVRYANTDGLTGLNNFRVFSEKLSEELDRAKRYARDLSLLMIDIDHFKSFNDIYGHQAGDHVLKEVARLITGSIRTSDFDARYGGEEFSAILPETTSLQALTVAERMRSRINKHPFLLPNGEHVFVTISIGCAAYPEDADDPESLIKQADKALYLAKETGRNRVCRHQDLLRKTDGRVPDAIQLLMQDTSLASFKELAKAIDAKSNYMKGHSFEVAALSVMTGQELNLSQEQIEGLRIASLLHDMGNLAVPDNILNKPGRLTEEEVKIIQGHPALSEMLLQHYPQSEHILPAILYHHERFDGKGYPRGLQEDEIPLEAKILAVVEAYHAMISPRPHRKRRTKIEAIAELEKEAGQQFDPAVVNAFVVLLKKKQDPTEQRRDKGV